MSALTILVHHYTHERAIGETGERVSNVTSVVGETRVRTSDHRSRNHPLRHRRSRRQTYLSICFQREVMLDFCKGK
jgi:hypothetical protein